jgi:hypothetical protein
LGLAKQQWYPCGLDKAMGLTTSCKQGLKKCSCNKNVTKSFKATNWRLLESGESEKGQDRFFVAKDGGFTSVGVVIALLLSLTLLFTTVQVHWFQSTSADIQFVADAGALAGENVVAEYMIIAQTADAIVLSLSLFGLAVFGIAIVVSCIPYCQEVGANLMEFGSKVLDARDQFATNAITALNSLQKALPFLIAVNASAVINGNHISQKGEERYVGIALPLPLAGKDVKFASNGQARNQAGKIAEQNQQTAELTNQEKEAYDKMQAAKLEGYLADCGNAPNYCLYERCGRLTNLNGAQNPHFASVNLWKFDYAMARAQAYYPARLASEKPESNKLPDLVRSFVRTRYFAFATQQIQTGYAHTAENGTLDAYFPLMPLNATELRQTILYTELVYPVSDDGVLHGCSSCPKYLDNPGSGSLGSVANLEAGEYQRCDSCNFDIKVLGNVANATSVIEVGFEYHYRKVADAAKRYQDAARECAELNDQAKQSANAAFDTLENALEALKSPRLIPRPPGRCGCIAVVIDISSHSIPQQFASSLVKTDEELPPRMAISAAALASDKADDTKTVLGSLAGKITAENSGSLAGQGLGIFSKVLEVWGWALLCYSDGIDSLADGLAEFLNSIPLVRSTPLAGWAKNALNEVIEGMGLQGANLSTPKPVLVNTLHVIKAAPTTAGDALAKLKEGYSALPGSGSGSILGSSIDGLLGLAEQQGGALLESEFTVFTIRFGNAPGLPEIPIKLTLPDNLVQQGKAQLSQIRNSVHNLQWSGGGYRVWE